MDSAFPVSVSPYLVPSRPLRCRLRTDRRIVVAGRRGAVTAGCDACRCRLRRIRACGRAVKHPDRVASCRVGLERAGHLRPVVGLRGSSRPSASENVASRPASNRVGPATVGQASRGRVGRAGVPAPGSSLRAPRRDVVVLLVLRRLRRDAAGRRDSVRAHHHPGRCPGSRSAVAIRPAGDSHRRCRRSGYRLYCQRSCYPVVPAPGVPWPGPPCPGLPWPCGSPPGFPGLPPGCSPPGDGLPC